VRLQIDTVALSIAVHVLHALVREERKKTTALCSVVHVRRMRREHLIALV